MSMDYSIDQLEDVSRQIMAQLSGNILLFYGAMGVGKTTLIKELVKQMGSKDAVSSPTFSLVNEYLTEDSKKIYHNKTFNKEVRWQGPYEVVWLTKNQKEVITIVSPQAIISDQGKPTGSFAVTSICIV